MELIFESKKNGYLSRLFKGYILKIIFFWICLLIIYWVIIPEEMTTATFVVFSLLTVLFSILDIPKFKFLLLSIEHIQNYFILNYMVYNKAVQKKIPIDDLFLELEQAWERGVTLKLHFFEKNLLLFTIFAKRQNKMHSNKSFQQLYNTITRLKE